MFYSRSKLEEINFKCLGENVLISDKCSIYGAENIEIGNNVRIDDFCILSAFSSAVLADNFRLRNRQLLVAAKRYMPF